MRLAKKIAAHIALWQRTGTKPGDVLILVRQRGPLFEAIIRQLKAAGIQVAGADRMVLLDHIAVMDLIALADALLLPEDDLALASVLKSPLFGLSEDDLFAIAHDRGRHSLRAALLGKASEFAARRRTADESRERALCATVRSPSTRVCSERAARESASSRGSDPKRMTHSTNFSISHWPMSGARRHRCRDSWPGCARPMPK